MNPEIKANWLEALRSGKYRQGRSRLKSIGGDRFCCLGVLVQVQKSDVDWKSHAAFSGPDTDDFHSELQSRSYAPADFSAGLDYQNQRDLAYMNDSKGMTFGEIADFIEQNF
jgi:hypothetical protein